MKVKSILKFAEGGVYTPSYAVFKPGPLYSHGAQPAMAARTAGDDGDNKLSDKDLMKMITDMDALPSDQAAIISALQDMYEADSLGLPSGAVNIATRYIGILDMVKRAKFSKEEYENAFKQVKDHGGLNEYAVTGDGMFIVSNGLPDGFAYATAEQLREYMDAGYRPLRNSDLLQLRAQNPMLRMQDGILSVVQGGMGMEQVTDLILKSITSLGSDTTSDEGYFSTDKALLIQGLQGFMSAQKAKQVYGGFYGGTILSLYKYKLINEGQAQQMMQAMRYIYSTLPENARALLKAHAVTQDDQGALTLVQQLIASKCSSRQEFDLTRYADDEPKTQKTIRVNDDVGQLYNIPEELKNTPLVSIVTGTGGVMNLITLDRGDGMQMSVLGKQFGHVVDRQGDSIGNTSLMNMLQASGLVGVIADKHKITYGDQIIPFDALQNITYNQTGVTRAVLPKHDDGTVRLDILENWTAAYNEIQLLGEDATAEQTAAIYEKHNLDDLLNPDGTLNFDKMGTFLITEGYTTDTLSGVTDSEFVRQVKDKDRGKQIIEDCLAVRSADGKTVHKSKVDRHTVANPLDWLPGTYDKIYKAAIYIPLASAVPQAAVSDQQKISMPIAAEMQERYQKQDLYNTYATASPDLLKNKPKQ